MRKSNELAYAWDVAHYNATGTVPPTWKRARAFKSHVLNNPPTIHVQYKQEMLNPYRQLVTER